ncbi:hypothetical protein OKW23_001043 [Bacilli bacterium PM5-9]|nr:hypothetical protein [Bacilli bacterium PM5-9]
MKKRKIFMFMALSIILTHPINAIESDIEKTAPLTSEVKETITSDKTKKVVAKSELSYQDYDIYNLNDWTNFVENSQYIDNATITLKNNIDLTNFTSNSKLYINKNVVLNGDNYYLNNYKNTHSIIFLNLGEIKNISFNNININHIAHYSSIIKENYGLVNNIKVNNSFLLGDYYVGAIAKNYGQVENVSITSSTFVGNRYVGSTVGLNTSFLSNQNYKTNYSTSTVTNSNASKINIRSLLKYQNKKYRNYSFASNDILGDHIGGLVGKNHNASLLNSSIDTITIYGDDYLGGIVGFNAYNIDNSRKSIVQNVNSKNITIYGGARIGGIIGYNVSYEAISLSKIAYNKSNHTSMRAILNNAKVSNNIYLSAYSEAGGAVGLNYSAKINNVQVMAIRKLYNIYTSVDEGAGLVADNEFGYVSNSKTNLNVKTKVFQAAGFCADNEGTITNSIAYGHVYTPKEAGGFIGSNLGVVYNSKSYGNIYVTKRIKVITKKKLKRKKGKKKKYKKIVKYYPWYSGNFAAYNGKEKYKGFNLKGKIIKSKYYGKRYLKKKKIKSILVGGYAK